MCRWLAYSGAPIYLEELLFEPEHSLIDQSLAARATRTTTNGDGFGIGWYGDGETPGLYRDIRPAWNDTNLRDLAGKIRSPLFLAHVRAATGASSIQRSNCHPFRRGPWLFMHNGRIRGYSKIRRSLAMAVAPELFPLLEGNTDSELMFHLALTFGLESDPVGAMERMVGLVEAIGREAGVEHPMQMSVCVSDGQRIFAFRYSTEHRSRSLYHNRSVESLRELDLRARDLAPGTFAVVSEPLTDLDDWEEIPESTVVTVADGELETLPFRPRPPR